MNYTTEIKRGTTSPVLAGTVRIILGLAIMIAGLYFWLFLDGKADGLGLLFLLSSPFVILTDKQESETRF
jgi:hypothetical protein